MQLETNFDKAIDKRYPEEIVILIVKSGEETYNPITIGWTMLASKNPPIIAVAISEKRYSFDLINKFKEFVISYPSDIMKAATYLFGIKSGRDINKLDNSKIKYSKTEKIDSVILNDAVANFECILDKMVKTGDHYVVFGKVLKTYISTKNSKRLYTIGKNYNLDKIEY